MNANQKPNPPAKPERKAEAKAVGRKPIRFLDRTSPPHLATLVLMAGMSALSINVFLPSLPKMAEWYDVPYGVMQQSVTLYLALSAVLQILIGPLADRFGRRPVLLISLAIFVLASVGTLMAPNATVFLICRMVQAVVASCMVLSRAIVRDTTTDDEAASQIAYVTMGMSLVPMISPMIGGWLDTTFGWHASFAFLAVTGALVLLLVWADLGETLPPHGQGEPNLTVWEQFGQYPRLLSSPRFWGYSLAGAFSAGTFYAYLGGAPFVGSVVFELSSFGVGVLFGLSAIGYMIGNFVAARLSVRVGMNRMILLGTVVTTFGVFLLLVLTLLNLSGPQVFFGLTVVMGIGNGICLPNANAGMVSVRLELAGSASGLGGAIMIGGGAALSALAGMMLVPGATELPLIWIMLVSSVGSVLAILLVMQRAKKLGLPR